MRRSVPSPRWPRRGLASTPAGSCWCATAMGRPSLLDASLLRRAPQPPSTSASSRVTAAARAATQTTRGRGTEAARSSALY
eukprot:13679329-Alexandrium_andersonii.AAC.1